MSKAIDVATNKMRAAMQAQGPPLVGSAKNNFAEVLKAIKNDETRVSVDVSSKLKVHTTISSLFAYMIRMCRT